MSQRQGDVKPGGMAASPTTEVQEMQASFGSSMFTDGEVSSEKGVLMTADIDLDIDLGITARLSLG